MFPQCCFRGVHGTDSRCSRHRPLTIGAMNTPKAVCLASSCFCTHIAVHFSLPSLSLLFWYVTGGGGQIQIQNKCFTIYFCCKDSTWQQDEFLELGQNMVQKRVGMPAFKPIACIQAYCLPVRVTASDCLHNHVTKMGDSRM